MGVWFFILFAILVLLGILGNWIDEASLYGGYMLMYVMIPYFVIWMIISGVKKLKQQHADAKEISNKEG